jgi:hypothetical protein
VKYSDRLAGSASTYARSLQAQSYAARLQWQKTQLGMQAAKAAANSPEAQQLQRDMAMLSAAIGALNSKTAQAGLNRLAKNFGQGGKDLAEAARAGTDGFKEYLEQQRQNKLNQQNSLIETAAANAMYDYTNSASGYWASESAVAAKYFSHDMSDSYPERQNFNQFLNQRAYDKDAIVEATGDGAKNLATGAVNRIFRAGGAEK